MIKKTSFVAVTVNPDNQFIENVVSKNFDLFNFMELKLREELLKLNLRDLKLSKQLK